MAVCFGRILFTWGAPGPPLEDERLQIAAISGTSAGAMDAGALADAMASGGPPQTTKRPSILI
jgi:NTE family protein